MEKTTKNLETDDIIATDTYIYENPNWEDQLTKFNNQEITYDEIGNPLSIGSSITMEWINGRSLKSYKNTAKNQEINYKYNKDGIWKGKTINGETTKYYLENNRIIYEQGGNNTIYYLYDLTGLVGFKYNDNIYYYVKNLQGDIIGILNQDYHQVVTYEYDSWGKLLSIKDDNQNEITDETNIGIINPFRYREYYYDTETGLYYLNSRYYNPSWRRFLNVDDILGANQDIHCYNLYAYVSNNPINNLDSNGKGLFKNLYNIIQNAVQSIVQTTKTIVKSVTSNSTIRQNSNSKNIPTSTTAVTNSAPPAVSIAKYNNHGDNDLPFLGNPGDHLLNPDGTKERWWGKNAPLPGKDRHHTDHGFPKYHPEVHDHIWGRDEDGKWSPGPPLPPSDDYDFIAITAGFIYGGYLIVKWGFAIFSAPATGGGSLAVAGVTP